MIEPGIYVPFIAITTAAFSFYNLILYHSYPIPFKLRKVKDPLELRKLFYDYVTAISSFIHAVILIVGSSIVLYVIGIDYNRPNANEENLLIAFSIGYFISDTILGIFAGYNDNIMLMHHLFGLFGLTYSLIKQNYGNTIVFAFVVAEISNPFMILRKNLDKHKGAEALSIFSGVIFSLTFIICRTVIIGYVMIPFFITDASLLIKLFGGFLWYLSLYWCYVIINLLIKALMEITNARFLISIYSKLSKWRKNGNFLLIMHLCFITLCFSITLFKWNHREII